MIGQRPMSGPVAMVSIVKPDRRQRCSSRYRRSWSSCFVTSHLSLRSFLDPSNRLIRKPSAIIRQSPPRAELRFWVTAGNSTAARQAAHRIDLITKPPGRRVIDGAKGVSRGIVVHRPTRVRLSLDLQRLTRLTMSAGVVEWSMFLVLTRDFLRLATTAHRRSRSNPFEHGFRIHTIVHGSPFRRWIAYDRCCVQASS